MTIGCDLSLVFHIDVQVLSCENMICNVVLCDLTTTSIYLFISLFISLSIVSFLFNLLSVKILLPRGT